MGVLNVTPDSFSDGGRFASSEQAVAHALKMVEEGARLIDIGGESTRPGARAVEAREELERILPVIEALRPRTQAMLSVDTSKPEVIRAVLAAGVDLINDVRALSVPGALEAVAESRCGVCLMHMQGEPATMQREPRYTDVVAEVRTFLLARVAACRAVGIAPDRILIDPGFGFGKTLEHNLQLLRELPQLTSTGVPVLVGLSRKSTVAALIGEGSGPAGNARLYGSLALAALAVWQGARVVRTHDVAATLDAVRAACAARGGSDGDRE
jgi:dihydropteroate synthase